MTGKSGTTNSSAFWRLAGGGNVWSSVRQQGEVETVLAESTFPLQEVAAMAVQNNRTNVTMSLFSRGVTGHVTECGRCSEI